MDLRDINAGNFEVWCENQHVLARIVQWDEVFGEPGRGAVTFSHDVTIHAPDATIGRKDRTVILRVVAAGPGNVSRGLRNPCTVSEGDLVVANLFHKTQDLRVLGENPVMFNWENIMARLHINEALKQLSLEPLQAFIVTKPNPDVAQRLMMGESRILSPFGDAQLSGGIESEPTFDQFGNEKKKAEKTKTVIEECVAVGPGGVVDGLWQEPPKNLPGAMVMFDTSVAPVRFVVGGAQYTLVHLRHVLLTFRGKEDERAQATEEEPAARATN